MLTITRVWQHRSQPDRVHFQLEGPGISRHLWAYSGSPLGRVLMLSIGGESLEISAADVKSAGG